MDHETPPILALPPIAIVVTSAKIGRKDRDKERFACLEGYLSIVCTLIEQTVKAKGHEKH